ncbi:MAG TPA: myxococcus cysteine-rich repeat containing protein [Kofleriaceae bacterium]|nr:myxococcus cysteine-rich repeat containing protein [Kofleriaceae bacterium]
MRFVSTVPFVLAASLFGGCVLGESQQSDELTSIARLSGAIFTTLPDGSRVNANLYPSKDDVYLDGGPGNQAPASAAALPEGDYYFQVTDPSGKVLLSLDAIQCRELHVDAAGLISAVGAAGCSHVTGIDVDHGALTVQLMPYADTPNPGGEYKVWITRVEDYDIRAKRFHGFVPSESKTDNFKVRVPELPPPPPPCEGSGCNPPPPPPCDGSCTPPPPPTSCVCGDGHLDAGEGCDDGNLVNGDGCSSTCTKESTSTCGGTCPTTPPSTEPGGDAGTGSTGEGGSGSSAPTPTPEPAHDRVFDHADQINDAYDFDGGVLL